MKISFFEDKTFASGVDCSGNPECIHVADLEIPEGQEPVLSKVKGKYKVSFVDIPQPQEPEPLPESNQ